MKKFKKPFPVRRTDTITRDNVRHALLCYPDLNAHGVAKYLIGPPGTAYGALVKRRHIERVERLMK